MVETPTNCEGGAISFDAETCIAGGCLYGFERWCLQSPAFGGTLLIGMVVAESNCREWLEIVGTAWVSSLVMAARGQSITGQDGQDGEETGSQSPFGIQGAM